MWQKYGPAMLVVITVLIALFLVVAERHRPATNEPIEPGKVVERPPESADVKLMREFPGKLRLNFTKGYMIIIARGELKPHEYPKQCANLVNLADKHAFSWTYVQHVEDGAMLQFKSKEKELPEGTKEFVEVEQAPQVPKKGDLCARLSEDGKQVEGKTIYLCLKEKPEYRSKYEVIGKITEGLEALAELKDTDRLDDIEAERVMPEE